MISSIRANLFKGETREKEKQKVYIEIEDDCFNQVVPGFLVCKK
jgi:hypothetical protein